MDLWALLERVSQSFNNSRRAGHTFPIEFHVAGKHIQTTAAEMPYLGALEAHSKGGFPGAEEYWGEDEQEYKKEMAQNGWWHPEFCDRSSEVVFMSVAVYKQSVVACDSGLFSDRLLVVAAG